MNLYVNEKKQKRPISKTAVIRIVIWSVVLVILCGVFSAAILMSTLWNFMGGFRGFSSVGYSYRDEASYRIGGGTVEEPISDIDIDWLSGQIEILPAEEGATEITISESVGETEVEQEDDRLRWRVHRGKLQIKFRTSTLWRNVKQLPDKKLTIRIPQTLMATLDQVNIDSVDTEVTFTGRAAEMDLDTTNGKLTVNGTLDELDADGVNIQLEVNGTVNSCNLDGVELTALLRLQGARELDISGVDQNVTLYLADTVTGFRVERETLGGKVQTNGFDGVTTFGEYDEYWGDGSLQIDIDGVGSLLKIEKLTND